MLHGRRCGGALFRHVQSAVLSGTPHDGSFEALVRVYETLATDPFEEPANMGVAFAQSVDSGFAFNCRSWRQVGLLTRRGPERFPSNYKEGST